MGKGKSTLGFVLGSICGAAVGAVAGVMFAPRSGEETRAMAADAVNGALDNALDTYEKGMACASQQFENLHPSVDATTDELRAKIDAARERMDQLRNSLSESVVSTAEQVQEAVDAVSDKLACGCEDDEFTCDCDDNCDSDCDCACHEDAHCCEQTDEACDCHHDDNNASDSE